MGAAHTVCHTTATAPRQPMAALARGLGAACRISVARLRPAESDVRGRSSTWSETFGAVWQVRGGAEAGFWVVWCAGWASRGLFRAHYAELPRLAHMSAMAAFAPALTPMLATPPARVFAPTNMLVLVLLLPLLCS